MNVESNNNVGRFLKRRFGLLLAHISLIYTHIYIMGERKYTLMPLYSKP